jgi:hypothetical protein
MLLLGMMSFVEDQQVDPLHLNEGFLQALE